jgi:hypothetical protein
MKTDRACRINDFGLMMSAAGTQIRGNKYKSSSVSPAQHIS